MLQSGIAGPFWVCHHPELEKYCLNSGNNTPPRFGAFGGLLIACLGRSLAFHAGYSCRPWWAYCLHPGGFMALISILEDIIECQAQAAGVELLDIDEDEMETAYFTVQ